MTRRRRSPQDEIRHLRGERRVCNARVRELEAMVRQLEWQADRSRVAELEAMVRRYRNRIADLEREVQATAVSALALHMRPHMEASVPEAVRVCSTCGGREFHLFCDAGTPIQRVCDTCGSCVPLPPP